MALGFVAITGFYIFDVPFPIFWGVIAGFFALIPPEGTAIIWVPASFYLVLSGYLTQDYRLGNRR
jgi:predicted PurR-regulated permease PerM